MNRTNLAVALRSVRDDFMRGTVYRSDMDELLLVLARIVEGRGLSSAFGAPGDWGYGTPIGDALAARSTPCDPLAADCT
jgi:hypothetical protein